MNSGHLCFCPHSFLLDQTPIPLTEIPEEKASSCVLSPTVSSPSLRQTQCVKDSVKERDRERCVNKRERVGETERDVLGGQPEG